MIEIIPAIDLIDGKCVRLSQGDFASRITYSDDPVEVAKRFAAAGFRRLHVVDLDGARTGRIANLSTLEAISRETSMIIDFGGGIKTSDDVEAVLAAGAAMATVGSVAVKNPDLFFEWIENYRNEQILLGADTRDRLVFANGWQTATTTEIVPFLRNCSEKMVNRAFVTDIAKDGLLAGPSLDLYGSIRTELPQFELIASGGVRSMADIEALDRIGCSGVIVGKAFYENYIDLDLSSQFTSAASSE